MTLVISWALMSKADLINELFKQRYEEETRLAFPEFRQLSLVESTLIRGRLHERAGLSSESSGQLLDRTIREKSEYLALDASMHRIDLKQTLLTLGAALHETILLENNWSDHIFEMRLTDAALAFHALWQPAAIDLRVLDSELAWVFDMDHAGSGWFLKL
jgi:hypothetical protein